MLKLTNQCTPSLTYTDLYNTHLEIWLTGGSHLHTGVGTITAAAHTFTSPIADTLVQLKTQSGTNNM